MEKEGTTLEMEGRQKGRKKSNEEEEKLEGFEQIEKLLDDDNLEDMPIVKQITNVSTGSNQATRSLTSNEFPKDGDLTFFAG